MISLIGRYGVIFYLTLPFFVHSLDVSVMSLLLPEVIEKYHIGTTKAGLLGTLYVVGGLAGALSSIFLSRYFHRFTIILVGMVVWIGGILVATQSDSYNTLAAARSIAGVGSSPLLTLLVPLINDIAPHNQKGLSIGFYSIVGNGGSTLSSLYANRMYDASGSWDAGFYYSALMMSVLVVAGMVLWKLVCVLSKTRRSTQLMVDINEPRPRFSSEAQDETETRQYSIFSVDDFSMSESSERGSSVSSEVNRDSSIQQEVEKKKENSEEGVVLFTPLHVELLLLAKNPVYGFRTVAITLASFSAGAYSSFSGLYMVEEFGMSRNDIVHFSLVTGCIANFVGVPMGSILYEWLLNRREPISRLNRCILALKGVFLALLGAGLIGFLALIYQTEWIFMSGFGAMIAFFALKEPIQSIALINSVPEEQVNTAALVGSIIETSAGSIPSPIFYGYLAKRVDFHSAMIICWIPLLVSPIMIGLAWLCASNAGNCCLSSILHCFRRNSSQKKEEMTTREENNKSQDSKPTYSRLQDGFRVPSCRVHVERFLS